MWARPSSPIVRRICARAFLRGSGGKTRRRAEDRQCSGQCLHRRRRLRARAVRRGTSRSPCQCQVDCADRLRPHHGRRALKRAPRWLPGQGHGHLTARAAAAASRRQGRRAAGDRTGPLQARIRTDLHDRHRLCRGRGAWHAVAGDHQRLAFLDARHLAGLARRRASSLPAPRPALVGPSIGELCLEAPMHFNGQAMAMRRNRVEARASS